MKKSIVVLIFVALSAFCIGCKKTNFSKEDVLKIIEEKGVDNVTWEDFENIEHEKDVGSGAIVNVYNLDNNVKLILSGNGDDKPFKIVLLENGKITTLKED